jgi:hypothetical protein
MTPAPSNSSTDARSQPSASPIASSAAEQTASRDFAPCSLSVHLKEARQFGHLFGERRAGPQTFIAGSCAAGILFRILVADAFFCAFPSQRGAVDRLCIERGAAAAPF